MDKTPVEVDIDPFQGQGFPNTQATLGQKGDEGIPNREILLAAAQQGSEFLLGEKVGRALVGLLCTANLTCNADGTLLDTRMFTNVVPGTFSVTETAVTGYSTTVACVDSDGSGAASTTAGAVATINLDAGETVTCTFENAAVLVFPGIPALPQWGPILLTLSLLTLATWQLAGQPVVVGGGTAGVSSSRSDTHHWLTSVLVGQGIATLGLVLYALLVGPLVPHDGVGALLAGLLIGVMVECYRKGRSL